MLSSNADVAVTAIEAPKPDLVDSSIVVLAAAIEREAGQVVGRIRAERIDLDQYLVGGVGPTEFQAGPGHYPGTPISGMTGNASLAGHRTTWGAPFNGTDELLPGDEISIDMAWGTAVYVVDAYDTDDSDEVGHFIVDPSEISVLDADPVGWLTVSLPGFVWEDGRSDPRGEVDEREEAAAFVDA